MSASSSVGLILLADHHPPTRLVVGNCLRHAGFTFRGASTLDHALLLVDELQPALVMVNAGIAFPSVVRMAIRWCHEQAPSIPTILLRDVGLACQRPHGLDADAELMLPASFDALTETVRRLIHVGHVHRLEPPLA